jgi:uncharacterized membrane protein YfcA
MVGDMLPYYSAPTLAMLAAAGFIAGLARGFSGFGAALIFVPLAGALVGPKLGGPMLVIIDGLMALPLIPGAWAIGNRREVGVMVTGAVVGIPTGTLVLKSFSALALRWLIAGLATAMLALLLSGWRYRGRPHLSATAATGAVSGLMSGIAQIGGPPVVCYWLGADHAPARFRANIILFFAATNVISLASYLWGGLLGLTVVALAAIAGPMYGVGIYFGSRMFGLASPAVFRNASLALIALAVLLSLPVWGR